MLRYFLFIFFMNAVICFSTYTVVSAESADCDAILVQQYEIIKKHDSAAKAWLKLIDEQIYNKIKTTGSASAFGDFFSGDFRSFNEKRNAYFNLNQYYESRDSAREVFKSYLTPDQISGWIKCKTNHFELSLYYKDIDKQGATIVLSWQVPAGLGPLNNISSVFQNTETPEKLKNLKSLNGTLEFPILRNSAGAPIRGTVSGKAGMNSEDYSASIYIPAYAEPQPPASPPVPAKMIVDQAGKVKTSIAYWSAGENSNSWECLHAPKGFDLVVIETENLKLGKRKGRCVGNGSYCDSHNEYCVDVIIKRGCLVSKSWHDWYKKTMEHLGLPYVMEAVCASEK